jgi:hypothetical protein
MMPIDVHRRDAKDDEKILVIQRRNHKQRTSLRPLRLCGEITFDEPMRIELNAMVYNPMLSTLIN